MSRIRSVHPGLFTDEAFMMLSEKGRLLLIALGTFSDYADRFQWDDAAISNHCGGDVAQSMDELERAGLVLRHGNIGEINFLYGHPRRYVSRWENIRSLVFIRDQHTCTYCGSKDTPLHCDHVIPVSRGGTDELSNLTTACEKCNLSKGSKLVEEWLA